MELRLPDHIARVVTESLTQSGTSETGGILMGEHVAEGVFRVAEITVQRQVYAGILTIEE